MVTVDGFLHLFDLPVPSVSKVTQDPAMAFLELMPDLKLPTQNDVREEKTILCEETMKDLVPSVSLFLPNCIASATRNQISDIELTEIDAEKWDGSTIHKQLLRTHARGEVQEWVTTFNKRGLQ